MSQTKTTYVVKMLTCYALVRYWVQVWIYFYFTLSFTYLPSIHVHSKDYGFVSLSVKTSHLTNEQSRYAINKPAYSLAYERENDFRKLLHS